MRYFCCDERRRNDVDQHPTLNGIDYLEVLDRDAPAGSPRQKTLLVRCLKPPTGLTAANVRIDGGDRVTPVRVQWATPAPDAATHPINAAEQALFTGLDDAENVLVVRTESAGDFSRYWLALVAPGSDLPPVNFDSLLSRIAFSFKVECPTQFDCKPTRICPPDVKNEPDINYLARDYNSFRRLMLDRMAAITPKWRDRNPADIAIAMVELLSYVGDRISYQQDAVATEAYLGTARRRVSVGRHARLVDYFMHNGCNARTWVQLEVDSDVLKVAVNDPPPVPAGTRLLSEIPGQPVAVNDEPEIIAKSNVVFETMHDVNALYLEHKELHFHTWGNRECCLPKGATEATLQGHFSNLKPGDVLVFEEVIGPRTGNKADADPAKRHAVRLTKALFGDENDPLTDPLNDEPITEIGWSDEDALPFPLCISARTDLEHGEAFVDNVSVARGNIVLADHGETIFKEKLGAVPEPTILQVLSKDDDHCHPTEREPIPSRFRPRLQEWPLTHVAKFDADQSARAAMAYGPRDTVPSIELTSELDGSKQSWSAKRDLLDSNEKATDFVVELETDATATLRFGDKPHGVRPEPKTRFKAQYRVGNGVAGNIGAKSLAHIVSDVSAIIGVQNVMPASGGTEPESIEDVRQRAPYAFLRPERAVTPADYAEVTQRDSLVQRAAATFRWTGSWRTVFVTADRIGGLSVDSDFEIQLRRRLERYRMAGYDLEVDGPRFVSLEIEMLVCVKPEFFRSDVEVELLEVFSNRESPDGRRGIFHPDNFTFGQPVYLSTIYAAAESVAGVASAQVTTFQRQGTPDSKPLEEGVLEMHQLEIARLDNDANFAERGVIRLKLGGGK